MAQFYKGLKANLPTTYEESAYYQTIDTGELFFAVSKTQLVKIGGNSDGGTKELVMLHLPEYVKPGNVIVKNNADGSILLTIPYEGEDIGFRVADGVDYSVECPASDIYIPNPINRTAIGDTVRNLTVKGSFTNGVYIAYTDKTFGPYSSLISGKTPFGVALITDKVRLILHPAEGSSKTWSNNTTTVISGVTIAEDSVTALLDFAGKANTDAVFASGLQGSAFTFARDLGADWYLPACGEMEEIRINRYNINTALDLIGGTILNFNSIPYWGSTQSSSGSAWGWVYLTGAWRDEIKNSGLRCRAVKAL